jgi:hypothetical protein
VCFWGLVEILFAICFTHTVHLFSFFVFLFWCRWIQSKCALRLGYANLVPLSKGLWAEFPFCLRYLMLYGVDCANVSLISIRMGVLCAAAVDWILSHERVFLSGCC